MLKSPAIHQTPLYRAKAAYRNMKIRCLNANGKNPAYANVELRMTMEEWLEWALPKYESLLKDNDQITLNASRFGDQGHYEIGNIEIITQDKNRKNMKTHVEMIPLICPYCKGSFEKPKRYVKSKIKNGHRIFCSRRCSGISSNVKKREKDQNNTPSQS